MMATAATAAFLNEFIKMVLVGSKKRQKRENMKWKETYRRIDYNNNY